MPKEVEKRQLFDNLGKSILNCDEKAAKELAQKVLEQDIDPEEALEPMVKVIREIGDKFETGELFLPTLVGAGEAMNKATTILEEEIERRGRVRETKGTVLIGTVKGDIHSIGKDLVVSLCKAHGFTVIDLGVDVSAEGFIAGMKEHNPDILGLSALMSTTVREQGAVVETLLEEGIRNKVKIMIGGAAASEDFAHQIGADGFAPTAPMAVKLAESLLKN